MKIAFVGTYPPRQCGIGTFTQNLVGSFPLSEGESIHSFARVIAIDDDPDSGYKYPEEVKMVIQQGDQRDYIKAAQFINLSDCELCIVQHEFGIFGGESGIFILTMLYRLKVPLIVTMHTVLKDPNFTQKSILAGISKKAQKIVVMSRLAVQMLKDIYEIPSEKIELIEHGVPDMLDHAKGDIRNKLTGLNRKILLSFGLLSRNKGFETVINALPKVVAKHPDLIYIILGETHPSVVKYSGEAYRNFLNLLVREKKLEHNVQFLKKFVSQIELVQYLAATDIYITPYISEVQITSGTLSYAVGAGAAVVSTPFWHAKELLARGRGEFFNFKDSDHLAKVLNDLLDHPKKLASLRNKALMYGKKLRWSIIGERYMHACNEAKSCYSVHRTTVKEPIINLSMMPKLSLTHMKRLTDDTGIVQHAKYGVPNLKEGYCLDDNARALLTALMAFKHTNDQEALELMPVYFSYINYMQNVKGTFRNFLSFDRKFLDEEGSEDAFGRTIWALGYLIRYSPNDAYYQLAMEIFQNAQPNFVNLISPRAVAYTIIGVSHYLNRFAADEEKIQILDALTSKMVGWYKSSQSKGWQWFEDSMTYDNGILPLSLFHAVEVKESEDLKRMAIASTNFLEKITLNNGYITPVGSDGWYPQGGECATYPQQATDVMAMVLLFFQAYIVTKDKKYISKMFQSYTWFLGENDLRMPLYDHETKGCCDGLEDYGVNRNQGAESTLAYLISHMTVQKASYKEFQFQEPKVKVIRPVKGPAKIPKKPVF